jgi:rhamnulose-1-phosphate aldolase/alcohol dehydrogenase
MLYMKTEDKWDKSKANRIEKGLAELVYRSNLLGSDRGVANWGGGNTSMKTTMKDNQGQDIEIMWVKGSGSDLGTMNGENFTALRLNDIKPLVNREEMSDEEMVAYLSQCMVDSNHPRSSIETLLHAFLPFIHVDHTHPDAIIGICCADNGKEIAKEIFGDRFVWVPYVRPGFRLSKLIYEEVSKNPKAELVLMEKHGLVAWGETSERSYEKTIQFIQEAEAYINEKRKKKDLFGGNKYKTLNLKEKEAAIQEILPVISEMGNKEKKVTLTFDDSVDVLTFVNSNEALVLSQSGPACPDHLIHTKRLPLYINWNPQNETGKELLVKIRKGLDEYKEEYQAYFNKNKNERDQISDTFPRVILIPGIGMVNTGKNDSSARLSGDLYKRAISVMAATTSIGHFVSLNEKESYDVEYWPLELYKLSFGANKKKSLDE